MNSAYPQHNFSKPAAYPQHILRMSSACLSHAIPCSHHTLQAPDNVLCSSPSHTAGTSLAAAAAQLPHALLQLLRAQVSHQPVPWSKLGQMGIPRYARGKWGHLEGNGWQMDRQHEQADVCAYIWESEHSDAASDKKQGMVAI